MNRHLSRLDLKRDIDWEKVKKLEYTYNELTVFCRRKKMDITDTMNRVQLANLLIDEYNQIYDGDDDFVRIDKFTQIGNLSYSRIRSNGALETVIRDVHGVERIVESSPGTPLGVSDDALVSPGVGTEPVVSTEDRAEDEVSLQYRGKTVTVSLAKLIKSYQLIEAGYSQVQMKNFLTEINIHGPLGSKKSTEKLIEMVRDKIRESKMTDIQKKDMIIERQARQIENQERKIYLLQEEKRKNTEMIREMQSKIRQLENEITRLYSPIYRAMTVEPAKFCFTREPGDKISPLKGEEFITVIENLKIFTKREIFYIVTLAKDLIPWDYENREKFERGAEFYARKVKIEYFQDLWDNPYSSDEDPVEDETKVSQEKLLKWLSVQNPTAYDRIIGHKLESQVSLPQETPRYDVTEQFYLNDLFIVLRKKRCFNSMSELIEIVLPLMTKCIRFYMDSNGEICCLFKLDEKNPAIRARADRVNDKYKAEGETYYYEEEYTEKKKLNIFKWGRQLTVLQCDKRFLLSDGDTGELDDMVDSHTEGVPGAARMPKAGSEWKIVIDSHYLKIVEPEVEVFVHTEVIYNAYRENGGTHDNVACFGRDVLSKNTEYFRYVGLVNINSDSYKKRLKGFSLLKPIWEFIRIRENDEIYPLNLYISRKIESTE